MFRTFSSKFKNVDLFTKINNFMKKDTNNIRLGRFNVCKDEKEAEIKSILNASDHCGDQICGNPTIVKNIIIDHKMELSVKDYAICCQLLGMHSATVCKNCPLN